MSGRPALIALVLALPTLALGTAAAGPVGAANAEATPAVSVSAGAGSPAQGWTTVPSSDVQGVNNFFVGSTCADAWECWNVGATIANGPDAAR